MLRPSPSSLSLVEFFQETLNHLTHRNQAPDLPTVARTGWLHDVVVGHYLPPWDEVFRGVSFMRSATPFVYSLSFNAGIGDYSCLGFQGISK